MAKSRTSPITLRFVFNRGQRTLDRKRWNAASRFVAKEIAMNMEDRYWKNMKFHIAKTVEADIRREMAHLAQEYLRLIVGISGNNEGPRGTIKTVSNPAYGDHNFASYNMNIAWDERSIKYLRRKREDRGHTHWFEYDHVLKRTMGKAETWYKAFGPIEVQVVRKGNSLSQAEAAAAGHDPADRFSGYGSERVRVQIGTIRVFAMRSITPQMLPALATGRIDDWAEDGTATGLIGRFPRDIQHGLAGNRKFVPYRHSVEPFLSFFLTRAIPNAVMRRLEVGLHEYTGRDEA